MKEFSEFIDISPLVSERTAVFPGDQSFKRNVSMSFEKNDIFELSSILTTLHVGSHLDAHSHFHPEGNPIHTKDVSRYIGPCQVVEVEQSSPGPIKLSHFDINAIKHVRVLFKTGSYPDPDNWNDDFSSIHPETVEGLAKKGVFLIGIDTPSVDPASSKTLDGHQSFYNNNICNLEGVVLESAKAGEYMLCCLPLKLENCEAAPVRAVLFR